MTTRRPLLALPLLLLAGCAQDPVADYLGGFGDPLRGAVLYAPQNLGDTSAYAGNPAGAAIAAAQMEFIARAFTTSPRYPNVSPTLQPSLDAARDEFRAAIGLNPRLSGEAAERLLRQVGTGLRAGDQAGVRAALSTPGAFAQGPEATIERLSTLPTLPRVRIAAGEAAAELDRLDRTRR